jgi:hypothetical protein
MSFETEVFNGKTLSNMFEDVYRNTESKRSQINGFVSSIVKLITTPDDAVVLGPIVKDFLDVQVKNDEHIVRLVQIAQRLVSVNAKTEDGGLLTDAEKEQLLKNVKLDFEEVLSEQEQLQDTINSLGK